MSLHIVESALKSIGTDFCRGSYDCLCNTVSGMIQQINVPSEIFPHILLCPDHDISDLASQFALTTTLEISDQPDC